MAGKKSFSVDMDNDPVMQFLSPPEAQNIPEQNHADAPAPADTDKTVSIPKGMKVNPALIEKRSGRIQLLVQPSLIEKVKAMARKKGCSMNDYVHSILEKAVEGNN